MHRLAPPAVYKDLKLHHREPLLSCTLKCVLLIIVIYVFMFIIHSGVIIIIIIIKYSQYEHIQKKTFVNWRISVQSCLT